MIGSTGRSAQRRQECRGVRVVISVVGQEAQDYERAKVSDRSFLFLLGSYRKNGNTEALARHAAVTVPEKVPQRWIRLTDTPLEPFEDRRHGGDGTFPYPDGNARILLEATLAATDLVIASPLYWYSLSAPIKHYLDYWSGWMRVPELGFRAAMRGNTMWAVTAISDEDPQRADHLLGSLRITADYMGMNWGGHVLGYSNRPATSMPTPTHWQPPGHFSTPCDTLPRSHDGGDHTRRSPRKQVVGASAVSSPAGTASGS